MRSEFSTPTKGLCFGSKLLFAEDVEFIRFRRIGFFQKARSVTSQPKHVHSIISQKLNLPLSFGNLTRMFGKGLCLAVIFGAVSVSSRRILQVQRRDEAIQIVKAPELCSSCRSSGATHGRLGSRNKFNTDKICSDAALPRTVVSCGEVVRDNNNNLLCGVVFGANFPHTKNSFPLSPQFINEKVSLESNLLCAGAGGAAITIKGSNAVLVSVTILP